MVKKIKQIGIVALILVVFALLWSLGFYLDLLYMDYKLQVLGK